MLAADVLRLQQAQFKHDQRNHSDIHHLPKPDRLKHYGLHYCKYVGRLARGPSETTTIERTVIDTVLVCLSAANTLQQRLDPSGAGKKRLELQIDPLRPFADAAGRFADACEKIDHEEEHVGIAKQANIDIFCWVLAFAGDQGLDLATGIKSRRAELAERAFYVTD
jgi:hypothetical protein